MDKDQTVVGEQCGYKFKDRLLRPAMVTVAKNAGRFQPVIHLPPKIRLGNFSAEWQF